MSLMNVMAEKGLLTQKPKRRAFVYGARITRDRTRSRIMRDLLNRVYEGSASALVAHLLQQAEPTGEELDEIRQAIADFERER
jgi:predicted transcriptional regulator